MSDQAVSETVRTSLPRGVTMGGLATAMFLVILDSSMVNLAGPTIRASLGITATGLTVVVDSYLVAFAGLLLLGGRLADVLGARKVFLGGMAVYLAASAFCALATSGGLLITGRIGQGIGAAAVVPAALALVLTLYPTPAERTRAMGVWGAVAGAGSLVGVFLGGTLTQLLGWQALFLTPVPFGLIGALIAWRGAAPTVGRGGRFDALGALTITAGISALALGMVSASDSGWDSPVTLIGLPAGLVCLLAFVLVERRCAHPLVPLGVFAEKPVVTSNLVVLLIGGTLTGLFFFLPQYQQDVLGMSPLGTGMAQLPLAGMIIVGSVVAPLVAKRIGLTRALPLALIILLAGFVWLVLDPTTSGFSVSLLGAFLLIGAGMGLGLVNATAMGVRNSAEGESGLLSGLINAAQQLGGAVGLAALAGIAIGTAGTSGGIGFTTAFLGESAFILIALLLSLIPSARTAPAPVTTRCPEKTPPGTGPATNPGSDNPGSDNPGTTPKGRPMNDFTVLVTGATGTVGSALVPALQARGVTVRAMTREADRGIPGLQNVIADLRDPESVAAALNGVDAAFLNSPSEPDAAALQIRFADLARQAGVDRLVLLSQYAARADSPVRFLRWHAEVEAHLAEIGLDHSVLRPNLYLQALLGFAGTIAAGWFAAPIGEAAVSAIDTRDIADAAATVLTSPGHTGRTYTLTGPRAVTHDEIAAALSAETGRDITFLDAPAEQFTAALAGVLPAWQLEGLVEDYAHYARGEADQVHTAVPELTGHPARDVTEFARDYASAFLPA
ncbi:MFS transporter [Sciscionella marina]|uniref:MFS transporter n=1 Tax=Sciscionella marina TaxID=508770 RepID=UPI000379CC64|nr:MFS transporter [Sciscionella marina]